MKKFAKVLTVASLGLAMVLLSLGVILISLNSVDKPNVQAAGGSGLSDDPYLISTAAELNSANIRNRMGIPGTHFKLTNDISLSGYSSWTPISLLANGSVFDGGGYTISDMRITAQGVGVGFFGNLAGTVKHLTFANVTVAANLASTGGVIAGRVSASSLTGNIEDARIEDVHVESGSVNVNTVAGGFVGEVNISGYGHTCALTIKDSTNKASVAAYAPLGGLVGYANGVTINIINSSNTGDVTGGAGGGGAVGGLLGDVWNSTLEIVGSYNSGDVSGRTIAVGGLVGRYHNNSTVSAGNNNLIVDHCYNSGAVESESASVSAGGIVGEIMRANATIEYTYNTGAVTNVSGNTTTAGTAGIIGEISYSASPLSVEIDTVYNTGTITGANGQAKLGGLVGYTLSNSALNINNTANSGAFVGSNSTSGGPGIAASQTGTVITDSVSSTGTGTGSGATVTETESKIQEIQNQIDGVELFIVTVPTAEEQVGYTFTGVSPSTLLTSGSTYTFTIAVAASYNRSTPGVSLTGTGEPVALTPTGTSGEEIIVRTYQTPEIIENVSIIVGGIELNDYDITKATPDKNEAGHSDVHFEYMNVPETVQHGQTLTFTLRMDVGYDQTAPAVTVGGMPVAGARVGDTDVFSFTYSNVRSDLSIAVTPIVNTYIVTVPAGNVSTLGWSIAQNGNFSVSNGGSRVVDIALAVSHKNLQVTITRDGGATWEELSPTVSGGSSFLVANVTSNVTLDAAAEIKKYTVVKGTADNTASDPLNSAGFTWGTVPEGTVSHGQIFSFTIILDTPHSNAMPIASITNDENTFALLTPSRSGMTRTYNVPANRVISGPLTLTIGSVERNDYAVSIPVRNVGADNLFEFDGADMVLHGEDYDFTVIVDKSHSAATPVVAVSGGVAVQRGTAVTNEDGTRSYSYRIANVQNALAVSVSTARNTYNVNSTPGAGFTYSTNLPAAGVPHYEEDAPEDSKFKFHLTMSSGYTDSTPVVKIGDETLPMASLNGNVRYYIIPSLESSVTVRVENIVINLYDITAVDVADHHTFGMNARTVWHGASLTFTVQTSIRFSQRTPAVSYEIAGVAGSEILAHTNFVSETQTYTYTIPGAYIIGYVTITVAAMELNTYNVFVPAGNLAAQGWIATPSGDNSVAYNNPFGFTVTVGAGYTEAGPSVSVNGGEPLANPVPTPGANGTQTYAFEITDITENKTVAVSVEINEYAVTYENPNPADSFEYIGEIVGEITHGESFTFKINVKEAFRFSSPAAYITVGDSAYKDYLVAPSKSGYDYTWTVPFDKVTGDIHVVVENVLRNTYSVIVPAGSTALGWVTTSTSVQVQNGVASVQDGGDFTFSITLENSHNPSTLAVRVNGTELPRPTPSGAVYTWTITNIKEDKTITVSADVKLWTVTAGNTGDLAYSSSNTDGGFDWVGVPSASIEHGRPYIFSTVLREGFSQSSSTIKVFAEGVEIQNPQISGGTYSWTIASVTKNTVVTVSGIKKNVYNVSLPTPNGWTLVAGASTVTHGDDYDFQIKMNASHSETEPTIKFNGSAVDAVKSQSGADVLYSYTRENVTGPLTIEVTDTAVNTYIVTASAAIQGYYSSNSFPGSVLHGQTFTFTVTMLYHYQLEAPDVKVDGAENSLTGSRNGSVFTYTIPSTLTQSGDIAVLITPTLNKYNVTRPNVTTGYTLTAAAQATHGKPYIFTLTLAEGYTQTGAVAPTVSGGSASITETEHVEGSTEWTWTVMGVSAPFEISFPTPFELNNYIVTLPESVAGAWTVSGAGSAKHGMPYVFTITLDSSRSQAADALRAEDLYKSLPILSATGSAALNNAAAAASGLIFTYEVTGVDSDFAIALNSGSGYELPFNEYSVTFKEINSELGSMTVTIDGASITLQSGSDTVESVGHGNHVILLNMTPNRESNNNTVQAVVVNGAYIPITDGQVACEYSINGAVTENLVIEVIVEEGDPATKYIEMTKGEGYTITNPYDIYQALNANSYNFTVTLDAGYSNSDFAVVINITNSTEYLTFNTDYTLVSRSGNIYQYRIESVTEDLTISVTGVVENEYTMTVQEAVGSAGEGVESITEHPESENPVLHSNGQYKFYIVLKESHNILAPTIIFDKMAYTSFTCVQTGEANEYLVTVNGITDSLTVTVSATKNSNTVTHDMSGEGWEVIDNETYPFPDSNIVGWGENYVFTIEIADSHSDAGMIKSRVSVSGDGGAYEGYEVTEEEDGIYTITVTAIKGAINIEIEAEINTYEVHGPSAADDEFSAVTIPGQVRHGETFDFSVTLDAGYTQSTSPRARVTVGGVLQVTLDSQSRLNNTYNFRVSGQYVTDDVTIEIENVSLNTYTVTLPTGGAAFGWTTENTSGSNTVTHGGGFTFKFTLLVSHNMSGSISVTGGTLGTPAVENMGDGSAVYSYSVTNIVGALVVTVPGISFKTFLVTGETGDGFTYGELPTSRVNYGQGFSFRVNLSTGWTDSIPAAFISVDGGNKINITGTARKEGSTYIFTVSGAYVTGNIKITAENVEKNKYTVTMPAGSAALGWTASPNGTITRLYGESWTFSVVLESSHDASTLQVRINGVLQENPTPVGTNGRTYTWTISNIAENKVISVSAELKRYDITKGTEDSNPNSGFTFGGIPALSVEHGAQVIFTVTLRAGYTQSTPVVKIGATSAAAASTAALNGVRGGNTFTYSFNADASVKVFVTEVGRNDYTVTVPNGRLDVNGWTAQQSGVQTVKHGDTFVLNVSLNPGYTDLSVSVTGAYEEAVRSGSGNAYAWTITNITGDITVAVSAVPRVYTVSFNNVGTDGGEFVAEPAGGVTVEYGQSFTFSLTMSEGYKNTKPAVSINGVNLNVNPSYSNGIYTWVLAGIDNYLNNQNAVYINVAPERDGFDVVFPSEPVGFSTAGNAVKAFYDKDYQFSVTVLNSHNMSEPVVYVNGSAPEFVREDAGAGDSVVFTYKVLAANVRGVLNVTVSGLVRNIYSVSFPINEQAAGAYSTAGNATTVAHGEDYVFDIFLSESHNMATGIDVKVNGGSIPVSLTWQDKIVPGTGRVTRWTVKGADVTRTLSISVGVDLNGYIVTAQEDTEAEKRYEFIEPTDFGQTYAHGSTFHLVVKMLYPCELAEPIVSAGGAVLNYMTKDAAQHTYSYSIVVTRNLTGEDQITVQPKINVYTMTRPANVIDYFSTAADSDSVTHGDDYTFQVTVASMYGRNMPVVTATDYDGKVSGSRVGDSNTWQFTIADVNSSKTISVVLEPNKYIITRPDDTAAYSTSSVSDSVAHGGNYVFNVELQTGYDRATGAGAAPTITVTISSETLTAVFMGKSGNICTYQISNVKEDITIESIEVAVNIYSVTIDGYELHNGTVTANKSTVEHNGEVVFTIVPAFGYAVTHIVINGNRIPTASGEYTYRPVITELTVYALFTERPMYRIDFSAENALITSHRNQFLISYEGASAKEIWEASANVLPSRHAYKISGWNTAADGSGTAYSVDLANLYFAGENIKLYAVWGGKVEYLISGAPGTDDITASPAYEYSTAGMHNNISVPRNDELYTTAAWEVKRKGTTEWVRLPIVGLNLDIYDLLTEEFAGAYAEDYAAAKDGWRLTFRAVLTAVNTYEIEADIITDGGDYGSVVVITSTSATALANKVPLSVLEGSEVTLEIKPVSDYYEARNIRVEIGGSAVDWNSINFPIAVTSSISISVEFAAKPFDIIIETQAVEDDGPGETAMDIWPADKKVFVGDWISISQKPMVMANYSFANYLILDNGGRHDILDSNLGSVNKLVDAEFLAKYLNGNSITIIAEYIVKRNITVSYDTAREYENGEFTLYYLDGYKTEYIDESYVNDVTGETVTNRVPITVPNYVPIMNPSSRNIFDYYMPMKLVVEPNPNYDIALNIADYSGINLTTEIGETETAYIFNLAQNMQLGIKFTTDYYSVAVQVRGEGDEYLGMGDVVYENLQAGSGRVPGKIDVPLVANYEFEGWFIKGVSVTDARFDGIISVDLSTDTLLEVRLTNEFVEMYANAEGVIEIVGRYSETTVLSVIIDDSTNNSANGYTINGEEMFADMEKAFDAGEEITIAPIFSKYYEVVIYDGAAIVEADENGEYTVTVSGIKAITLNFIPLPFGMKNLGDAQKPNGVFEVSVNGNILSETAQESEAQNAADVTETFNQVRVGDTIVVRFTPAAGYSVTKITMTNGNGTKSVQLTNGQSILVTGEWLDEWLADGKLEFTLEAETALSSALIAGIGATAVLVPLILILSIVFIISIKRKKKDYLIALEKSKQNAARMQSTQMIGNLLKSVESGEQKKEE